MPPHPFLSAQRRLRSGWWIVLFFLVLAGLLFPLLLSARADGDGVPIYQQALVVLAASLLCQMLRRKPLGDLLGALDWRWPQHLALGAAGGALLMLVPALVLAADGVRWQFNTDWIATTAPTLALLVAAAATEELLFRGFLFQRLIDGLGAWPAQLIIAALFTLTHSDALREQGALGYLAGINIFLASIMFGLAYLRTRGLAMPLGLHFAANAVQGPVLGFGVSGGAQPGLLTPLFGGAPDWLTGGSFGLEASAPGLACVIALTFALRRWTGATPAGERTSQSRNV